MSAELLLALALLGGCIDDLLEAPYVLTTGLDAGATRMTPTARGTLLVAGPRGVTEVDGSGALLSTWPTPARAAVGHAAYVALVDEAGVRFGPSPAPGAPFQPTSRVAVAGVRDARAWCDGQLALLVGDDLLLLRPGEDAPRPWLRDLGGARAFSLGPDPACADAWVLTERALVRASATGRQVVLDDLAAPRALAVDGRRQPWLVHGEPPVLARVQGGAPETIARHLAPVVDLHFGTGGLLHPDNVYMLTADGTIDYVRVPTGAPAP